MIIARESRGLCAASTITMLIVTHEMQFARDVSNRVLMFGRGSIVEEADPETMFSSPREQRTHDFLSAVLHD